MKIVAGGDVMLPCKTSNSSSSGTNETPPVSWKREITGSWVPLNPRHMDEKHKQKYKVEDRVFWYSSPEEEDWGIKVFQVVKEDAGMYQCTVNNSTETLRVELLVEGDPYCFDTFYIITLIHSNIIQINQIKKRNDNVTLSFHFILQTHLCPGALATPTPGSRVSIQTTDLGDQFCRNHSYISLLLCILILEVQSPQQT